MDGIGTEERVGTDDPCRALVVVHSQDDVQARDVQEEPVRRLRRGRPMAGFLAQLIVDTDPTLRTARSERTRVAAALYAQAAGTGGGRRRA